MAKHTTQLVRREEVAEGTMAFTLEKPAGFKFRPGQNMDFKLINPTETDSEGDERTFSIASAPFENPLMFATRMRDTAFKRVIKSCPLPAPLEIDGPHGNFYLHSDRSRPAVLIAGGIGITPFFSIIRQATYDRLAQDLILLYSNHRPEDAPFLAELGNLARQNTRFTLTATMTGMEKSKQLWKGQTGLIDRDKIRKTAEKLNHPVFYIAGPPAMVAAVQELLTQEGISDDDVKFEEFAGY